MTSTVFRDSAGIRGLALVNKKATAYGARLHMAVTAADRLSRVIDLMILNGVLHVYPSVEAAAADTSGGR